MTIQIYFNDEPVGDPVEFETEETNEQTICELASDNTTFEVIK